MINYLSIWPLCSLQFYPASRLHKTFKSCPEAQLRGRIFFFFPPKLFHLVTLLFCDWLGLSLLESILAKSLLEIR